MTLKLFVTKKSDNLFSEDYEFRSFPIFMGRDGKNEVILPDAYKIISRKHAKISEKENTLELTDLESANFTYLNGEKLEANKEYHLSSGDKIKIGDYELNIEIIKKEIISDDNQKTMLFSSPFADEIAGIAENLKALSSKFSLDNSPVKTDMLKYSIMQSLHNLEKNDANKILAEFFSENFLGNSRHTAAEQKHEFSISSQAENEEYKLIRNEENYKTPPVHDPSFSMHFSNSTDVLLDTFAKLVQGFLQFRQEFFGVTIYHTLPVGSLEDLKEYLFNPNITSEEERKRINLLNEEIQNLLAHQVGLLEGYKTSVMEGSKALLQSLDPQLIEQELQKKNMRTGGLDMAKIIPLLGSKKILEAIKENFRKYVSDPYHIEKKFFRPHYLKGYQKRTVTGRAHDEY